MESVDAYVRNRKESPKAVLKKHKVGRSMEIEGSVEGRSFGDRVKAVLLLGVSLPEVSN